MGRQGLWEERSLRRGAVVHTPQLMIGKPTGSDYTLYPLAELCPKASTGAVPSIHSQPAR